MQPVPGASYCFRTSGRPALAARCHDYRQVLNAINHQPGRLVLTGEQPHWLKLR
jgi:hypothetical protein